MQRLPDFKRNHFKMDVKVNTLYLEKKLDRDLIPLPNDRNRVVALISIDLEFLMGCPD